MGRWLLVSSLLFSSPAWAIFTNGGFETGDFSGWTKTIGSNPGLTGAPPFTGANIQIGAGGADTSAVIGAFADPHAPQLSLPRVGAFTGRVNDEGSGAVLNSIKQSAPITAADVDSGDGLPHVRFSYAAVLEDPGHPPTDQPYFYVVQRNLTKGTILYEDFTYSGQPGKTFVTTGGWKSTNFINVDVVVPTADLGDTLEIEAIGADCSQGAHGGYVYLDGFGSAVVGGGATPIQPVPTLSQWALIGLAMLLFVAAALQRRRG
jgi:hypothetical protein